MAETKTIQEQHTAGLQAIGFDYQFYYFMLLALDLKFGQKLDLKLRMICILIKKMERQYYIRQNIQS